MLTDVHLRSASDSDIPVVAALLARCGLPNADVPEIIERFHVALHDGQIIGCAAVESHGLDILIRSVAVEPAYREQGVATDLVAALLIRAQGGEARAAYLLSTSAPAYFARWGFSLFPLEQVPAEVSASPAFQRAKSDSALCMRCPLR
jgi:amino-acid N-acetyltransferase